MIGTSSLESGWRVVGNDGSMVGRVDAVEDSHVVVERDALGEPPLYVPDDAIARVDPERHTVELRVPADDVDARGWRDRPGEP